MFRRSGGTRRSYATTSRTNLIFFLTGDASASPLAALSGSQSESPRLCRGIVASQEQQFAKTTLQTRSRGRGIEFGVETASDRLRPTGPCRRRSLLPLSSGLREFFASNSTPRCLRADLCPTGSGEATCADHRLREAHRGDGRLRSNRESGKFGPRVRPRLSIELLAINAAPHGPRVLAIPIGAPHVHLPTKAARHREKNNSRTDASLRSSLQCRSPVGVFHCISRCSVVAKSGKH